MADVGLDGWIPTEKTSTFLLRLGGSPLFLAAAVYIAFIARDFAATVALVVGIVYFGTAIGLVFWMCSRYRPSAVRVTGLGIDVRGPFGRRLTISAGRVHLTSAGRDGFGKLQLRTAAGKATFPSFLFLSPKQLIEAKRYFPVSGEPSIRNSVKQPG